MKMSIQWSGIAGADAPGAAKRPATASDKTGAGHFEKELTEVAARIRDVVDSGTNGKALMERTAALQKQLLRAAADAGTQAEPLSLETALPEGIEAALAGLDLRLPAMDQPLPQQPGQAVAATWQTLHSGAAGRSENAAPPLQPLHRDNALEALMQRSGNADGRNVTTDLEWQRPVEQASAAGRVDHAAVTRQSPDLAAIERSLIPAEHRSESQNPLPRFVAGSGGIEQSSAGMLTTVQNPAGAATAASASPGAGMSLSAPLNSQDWQQELGQRMASLAMRGGQNVSLQLNPPELGPLLVDLKLTDQHAQLQFLSAQPQVRGAVEQAIPLLREALAEHGITLGQTSVGDQRGDKENPSMDQDQGGGSPHTADDNGEPTSEEPGIELLEPLEANGRVNLYI
ncbi:MAG: flagellar hook-length control protein FliK [Pseudohongiellaceae bacterium]